MERSRLERWAAPIEARILARRGLGIWDDRGHPDRVRSDDWTVVGIDPAPSKPAVVCRGSTDFESVCARELPAYVASLLGKLGRVFIAWDAPLSFAPENGFSDRPVDRETRAWVKSQVKAGRIEGGAVSVLPFSGCPHWAITCAALGMLFGTPPVGLQLAGESLDGAALVVEVHPAVSLAYWWVAERVDRPMPKYKGVRKREAADARAAIRAALASVRIPATALVDDDHLDAWVAWRMAHDFLEGRAMWSGTPRTGGYVVPRVDLGT